MELQDAIKNRLPDDIATHENHLMNNAFISFELDDTQHKMQLLGYTPIGYCYPPYTYHNKHYYALVFEDESFCKYWCHVSEYTLKNWKRCDLSMSGPH